MWLHLKLALFQTKGKKNGKLIILWFIVEAGYNFFCSLFDCICVFFFFCVVVLCFFGEMSIDVLSEKANCYIRTAIISWQLIVVYVVHNVNIEMHYFFWEGVLHIFNITWQKDKSSHLLASLIEMILSIPIS